MDFFVRLFDTSDFTRRWDCGAWPLGLGWLHVLSDLAIRGAYVAIPIVLGYFVLRKQGAVPFPKVFWLFVAFIFACGTTHLMAAVIFWWPVYRLDGLVKVATAAVSWATVVALVPVLPRALALPSPGQLEREIADRRRAEAELHRLNTELEQRVMEQTQDARRPATIVESAHDAIFTRSLDGTITTWNQGAERLYGYTAEEAVGQPCWLVIPPEYRDQLEDKSQQLMRGEPVQPFETQRLCRHGHRVFVSIALSPIRDTSGQVVGIASFGRDISDRKRAERELVAAKDYAQSIVETLHEPLLVLRPDLIVQSVNMAFYDNFRVSPDQTLGRKVYDLGNGQWNIPALQTLLEDVLPESNVFNDYEVSHDFEDLGHRVMLLNARRLDSVQLILLGIRDVTDRKRVETELRTAHQRLAAVVETAPSLIVVTDRGGRVVHFNRACEELTGYSRDEVLGRSILDRFVPAEWRPQVAARFADPHAPELQKPHENPWLTRTGEERMIEWRCTTLPQSGNEDAWFLLGIGIDITERRQSEESLRVSEERLRMTLQGARMAAWSVDQSGHINTTSNFVEISGAVAPKRAGEFLTSVHPDDREGHRAAVEEALRAGGPFRFRYRVVCGDQREVRWLEERGEVRKDPLGTVVAIVGIVSDVTQSRRYEQSLRESEERLRAVLNTAADAIITINQQGIIQSANPATEKMFGYTAAEMIGQNVKMLMPPPYWDEHDGYLAKYLETGVKQIIGIGREVEARHKDGTVFPVDLAVSEVDHLGLFTGIVRNLTRRKELEREVIEIAALEQRRIGADLHDSVGQEVTALNLLVGDLANTLRTNAAEGPKLVERMAQALQRVQGALRGVIRGLFPVPVDEEGLMASLADLAERISRDHKVNCVFDCPDPVIVVDNVVATHLYHIAQEAVTNAVKHARPRNICISLRSDHRLTLRVEDDGAGISPEVRQNGGIGLRIMRNRAAVIGATLTIEPIKPTGTAVTCVLMRKRHE